MIAMTQTLGVHQNIPTKSEGTSMLSSSICLLTATGIGVIFMSKSGVLISDKVPNGCEMQVPNVVKHPLQTHVHPWLRLDGFAYGPC